MPNSEQMIRSLRWYYNFGRAFFLFNLAAAIFDFMRGWYVFCAIALLSMGLCVVCMWKTFRALRMWKQIERYYGPKNQS